MPNDAAGKRIRNHGQVAELLDTWRMFVISALRVRADAGFMTTALRHAGMVHRQVTLGVRFPTRTCVGRGVVFVVPSAPFELLDAGRRDAPPSSRRTLWCEKSSKSIDRKLRTSRGSPSHMRMCTAKASGISRESVKSGCAREWGGWRRLSDNGPGQLNPDRNEAPGVKRKTVCTEVLISTSSLTQSRELTMPAESTKDDGKPVRREGLV